MAWLQQMNPTRNARRSAARARHCPGTAPANAEALGGPRSPRDDLREIPRDRPPPGQEPSRAAPAPHETHETQEDAAPLRHVSGTGR